MRVLNYLELEDRLQRAGHSTAVEQQRRALARADADLDVITSPWSVTGIKPFDLAHLNMFGPGSLAVAKAARRRGRPLICHAHTTSEDFRDSFRGSNHIAKPLRRYLRWFYSQADLVLCPSEHTRSLLAQYPIDAPIVPITNGVDLDSLADHDTLRSTYRDRYDLSGMVVFSVGNVFERKGLSTFCRVAQATEYDFAWFGPYEIGPFASPTVRRWVRDPPQNVTFTGWVEQKAGMFGAGDVLFFPAKEENQGIAVLEAMACGKAVVLSDIPVFAEYYEDGTDCLIRSTEAEYREALDRLAADPGLRDQLGANARETAEKHSLDRIGERLVEAYRRADRSHN